THSWLSFSFCISSFFAHGVIQPSSSSGATVNETLDASELCTRKVNELVTYVNFTGTHSSTGKETEATDLLLRRTSSLSVCDGSLFTTSSFTRAATAGVTNKPCISWTARSIVTPKIKRARAFIGIPIRNLNCDVILSHFSLRPIRRLLPPLYHPKFTATS